MRWRRMFVLLAGLALVLAAAPAMGQERAEPDTAMAAPPLEIAEHGFGLGIAEREIEEPIETFHKDDVVYLWMRVEGGPADPILVTWSTNGLEYDVELRIGGSSWRTWARKTLYRSGDWTVRVTDAQGRVLLEKAMAVSEQARPETNEPGMEG